MTVFNNNCEEALVVTLHLRRSIKLTFLHYITLHQTMSTCHIKLFCI